MKTTKTRSSLPCLLALACLLCAPLCARAATLVVTSLADSGPGTLRQAIANAGSGDTIIFATNGMITLATGLVITNDNDLTIVGPGPTNLIVNGNGQHYSVFVFRSDLNPIDNVSGLTIKNGVGGQGGGIQNWNTLVLSNCVITGNTVLSTSAGPNYGIGGGVYNLGMLTMIACTVTNNTAGSGANGAPGANDYNGPLANGGNGGDGASGGGLFNSGTLLLTACTVVNNAAGNGGNGGVGGNDIGGGGNPTYGGLGGNGGNGGSGGGLFNRNGTVLLSACTISGNTTGNGGAGGNGGNDSGLVNAYGGNGGNGGNAGIGGAVFNGSSTSDLVMKNCTAYTNVCGYPGGPGLGGTASTQNGANGIGGQGGLAGGVYNYGSFTLNNCTLTRNSAYSGGGIYQDTSGLSVLTNTIVAYNTASIDPNIHGSLGLQFTMVNSLIAGNPLLAPLGNYGGSTQTAPPLPGSPAIDAGTDSATNYLTTDQRGYPRLAGGAVDIGAVEYQPSLVITTNADSGPGSLRQAVPGIGSGGVITFANTLCGQTILLTSGRLVLNNSSTIDASSLPCGLTISGNNSNTIFEVGVGATLTLNSLTLINGYGGSSSGSGGGILVDTNGTLTLNNSTLYGNSAYSGGGIASYGFLTLNNSTLYSNNAELGGGIASYGSLTLNNSTLYGNTGPGGGGIYNLGTLTLNDSTLYGNTGVIGGGGIENYGFLWLNNSTLSGNLSSFGGGIFNDGSLWLTNTIVAGNSSPHSPVDIYAYVGYTAVNSLTNVNPLLAPLGNYGGPTPTMPPLAGSPAIDAGTDSVTNFLATDQRGFPRLKGAHVDIGAVEVQTVSAANAPTLTNPVRQANGAFSFSFTNLVMADFTVLTSTNVALPLGQWSILGAPMQYLPGQYQFTDFGATNYPQRFYKLVSP